MNPSQDDPDQVFESAVSAHEAGDLERAERLYRRVIDLAGEDAVSLELLGAVLVRLERRDEAIDALDRSISMDGSSPTGWLHRAEARLALGDRSGAESDLRECLKLDPGMRAASFAVARLLLDRADAEGALAALPVSNSDPAELRARESLRLEIDLIRGNSPPQFAEYQLSDSELASSVARACVILVQASRFDEAARACLAVKAERVDGPDPVAMVLSTIEIPAPGVAQEFRRSIALHALGEVGESAMLGLQAAAEGDSTRAIERLSEVLERRPDLPDLAVVLATLLRQAGRAQQALPILVASLDRSPEHAGLHREFGRSLLLLHRHAEGEAALRTSLSLSPDQHELKLEIASMLLAMGRPGDSLELVREVPSGDPTVAAAATSCTAEILAASLRQREAVDALRAALDRDPDHPILQSQFLYLTNFPDGMAESEIAGEHRHRSLLMAPSADPPRSDAERRAALGAVLSRGRRIRLGFLSPDLRRHSVWYFIEPLLASLDRDRFEVVVFSDVTHPDAFTDQLRRHCDLWSHVSQFDDAQLCGHLRESGLDILVELSGHTNRNRLAALARRVAPIQASYLGYPNTTGIGAIDFRIVDGVTDPPGSERYCTESLLRMPRTFLCYRQDPDAPPHGTVRPRRPVTFGCFNNLAKVTRSTVRAWAAALEEVPDARLVVKSKFLEDPNVGSRLLSWLDGLGVDPSRVTLLRRASGTREHLALYGDVDVALDTFPYHGTTTTCEALSMGVPVVTLKGESHRSRVGASLLHSAGLDDLIADDEAGFARAAALAADRAVWPRRDLLRGTTLADPRRFAEDFLATLVENAS